MLICLCEDSKYFTFLFFWIYKMPVGLLRNESTAAGSGMYCANQLFASMTTLLNHSPRVPWQPSDTIPLYVLPRLIEMARPMWAGPVQLRPVGPGVLGSTLYGNAPSDSEPSVVVGRRATVATNTGRCIVNDRVNNSNWKGAVNFSCNRYPSEQCEDLIQIVYF